MECKRKLLNILVNKKQNKIIQIYLHLLKEHFSWFNSNKGLSFFLFFSVSFVSLISFNDSFLEDILKELCLILQDNLDILQQQVHDLESSSSDFSFSFFRLRGETVSLAYKVQRKSEHRQSILVCDDLHSNEFRAIPTASFIMNPVYIFPYGTYPLLPAPYPSSLSSSSSSLSSSLSMSITNYFRVIK